MSLPAREVDRWDEPALRPDPWPDPWPDPSPERRRAATPARPPATRPPIPNPPHPHRRTRRGHHSAFWIFTTVLVSSMVVGLVSLNAMRVDAAYRTRSVTERVRLLSDERRTLENDVARLSSPSRIGTWARRQGLVHPAAGDVVILQVPARADGPGATSGSGA